MPNMSEDNFLDKDVSRKIRARPELDLGPVRKYKSTHQLEEQIVLYDPTILDHHHLSLFELREKQRLVEPADLEKTEHARSLSTNESSKVENQLESKSEFDDQNPAASLSLENNPYSYREKQLVDAVNNLERINDTTEQLKGADNSEHVRIQHGNYFHSEPNLQSSEPSWLELQGYDDAIMSYLVNLQDAVAQEIQDIPLVSAGDLSNDTSEMDELHFEFAKQLYLSEVRDVPYTFEALGAVQEPLLHALLEYHLKCQKYALEQVEPSVRNVMIELVKYHENCLSAVPEHDFSAGIRLVFQIQVALASESSALHLALLKYHKFIVMYGLMVDEKILLLVKLILNRSNGPNQDFEEKSTSRENRAAGEAEVSKQQLLKRFRDPRFNPAEVCRGFQVTSIITDALRYAKGKSPSSETPATEQRNKLREKALSVLSMHKNALHYSVLNYLVWSMRANEDLDDEIVAHLKRILEVDERSESTCYCSAREFAHNSSEAALALQQLLSRLESCKIKTCDIYATSLLTTISNVVRYANGTGVAPPYGSIPTDEIFDLLERESIESPHDLEYLVQNYVAWSSRAHELIDDRVLCYLHDILR